MDVSFDRSKLNFGAKRRYDHQNNVGLFSRDDRREGRQRSVFRVVVRRSVSTIGAQKNPKRALVAEARRVNHT